MVQTITALFPGGHGALVPPDPIPNSEVKRCIADDSVGPPHVKVGHRQGLIPQPRRLSRRRGFRLWAKNICGGGARLPRLA